jgi:ectoine hydroxylase-related dioxygenase (phytanoyl-CoA dioxygenase family)
VRNTDAPTLHRWNTGFEWHDRTGPFQFLDDKQVQHFDELGFVLLPRLVDDELLERVRAETDRFEEKTAAFLAGLDGERISIAENGAITFSANLVARSPLLRELSEHPSILGICADLVGPDVNMYWDQAVYKKPEKPRRFPWHQDNGYAFLEPQQYLTIWIALTDATLENGCPNVAPRHHRRGTLAHTFVDPLGYECFSDPEETVAAEVSAGGAVVFSSLTPHLTGPNTTDAVRKAYILQYAPAGAEVLNGDPEAGPPTGRTPANVPERQYPVLIGGKPAAGAHA